MSNIQETSYMWGGQGPKGLQSHGKKYSTLFENET
jgi:hypothetical protein